MVNKKRAIKLLQKLIQINSENPPGDESQIASFVKNYLEKLGLKAKIYEFKKRRANVVAYLGSGSHGLLITPHLDTVPRGQNWHFKPFSGTVYKNRIYGLGATDCKVNVASALEAVNSLIEDEVSLNYNLIFAATADEESGSNLGIISLLNKGIVKPDAALVLDSDNFGIVVTQKGLLHLKVKLKGKRAHGAYPWRGINAIDIAAKILQDLKKPNFLSSCRTKYLRPATMNIGTIKGGDKVNIVADWCEFELDFRFLPGMAAEEILKKIRRVLKKHTHKFQLGTESIQKPYLISEGHALVKYLKLAIKKIGIRPLIKGSEGATTITFFQKKNIPAVATGFGSEGCAHTPDEYAKIENLYQGALVLEEFLKQYNFRRDNHGRD